MLVVDASVIVEILLGKDEAHKIADLVFDPGWILHAPHLISLEVASAFRRFCMTGQMSEGRARSALSQFAGFPIHRHAHDLLLDRVWELRHTLTCYDAAYVALSEALDATLLTRDRRLAAGAVHYPKVQVI